MWREVFRRLPETVEKNERFRVRLEPLGALVFDKTTGFIVEMNRAEVETLFNIKLFPKDKVAPRFVHIELTNKCNLNCPECYVERDYRKAMSFKQLDTLLSELAEIGVFSVTFGGGEPLLRGNEVYALAKIARALGLGVAMTTNGTLLEANEELATFHQVNISVHHNLQHILRKAIAASAYTKVGINFVVSKGSISELRAVAEFCKKFDFELLLLSYKPVKGDLAEAIPATEVLSIAKKLAKDGVKVASDGMSVGLCKAADYFVDISCEGDVFPCSFVRKPIGNVLREKFSEIWEKRPRRVSCPFKKFERKAERR
ncbi:MAG: radical SAM protein [Candidatus Bathyarchaeia archaeon]